MEEVAGPARLAIQLFHDEELIAGPVEQRAREIPDLAENRIGMVDGRDDVALGREIFGQIGEQGA